TTQSIPRAFSLRPLLLFLRKLFRYRYTFMGAYERAVLVSRRVVKSNPGFVAAYKPLIASLGHLDRCDEATAYVKELLTLEPSFTVKHFGEVCPCKKPQDRTRYMEGLRLAGIPERPTRGRSRRALPMYDVCL